MSKRKAKTKKEAQTTWDDVIEMVLLVDGAVRKVAQGTLEIKENPETKALLGDREKALIDVITQKVVSLKDQLITSTSDVPRERGVAVTEELYPSYFLVYNNLVTINDEINSELMGPFAELTELALAAVDKETEK